eukprot:m.215758 g.215758  ORF g.215758 m.215758 type:complete len:125 (-) comp26214_c1_seq1:1509-1883(-)
MAMLGTFFLKPKPLLLILANQCDVWHLLSFSLGCFVCPVSVFLLVHIPLFSFLSLLFSFALFCPAYLALSQQNCNLLRQELEEVKALFDQEREKLDHELQKLAGMDACAMEEESYLKSYIFLHH